MVVRAADLFAIAASVAVATGLFFLRREWGVGMLVSWRQTAYMVPNALICFGVASVFCFFAALYSIYLVPWSGRVALWHLGLSVAALALYGLGLAVRLETVREAFALPLLIGFVSSPFLFLLVQGVFLVDGLRRLAHILWNIPSAGH